VAHLKLIAKLRREQYGQSAERGRKLLDQLELQRGKRRPARPRTKPPRHRPERRAERECIDLTAGRAAKGHWQLSPQRRAAVIRGPAVKPAGNAAEITSAAGVSRATVSLIERGDRRRRGGPDCGPFSNIPKSRVRFGHGIHKRGGCRQGCAPRIKTKHSVGNA
jgi:hypothetical protein